MATIKKRGDSYLIRVSCGYDVNGKHKEQSMTWKPDEGMTKKQIEKELNRQAVMFGQSRLQDFCYEVSGACGGVVRELR